jgi:hypothetical protein
MSNLHRRNNTILKVNSSDSTRPDFGASYDVTAYSFGAVANGAQAATGTVTVHDGHGFVANEFFIVGTDSTTFKKVASVTTTTLVLDSGTVTVADDDVLLNLGTDTGTTSPNYDGSTVTVYTDSAGSTSVSNSRVTANARGQYGYWVNRSTVWELVRDSSAALVQVIPDAVYFGRILRATSLPTLKSHEVTYGIKAGGTGVPDQTWVWMKKEDDTWNWVGPITVAP